MPTPSSPNQKTTPAPRGDGNKRKRTLLITVVVCLFLTIFTLSSGGTGGPSILRFLGVNDADDEAKRRSQEDDAAAADEVSRRMDDDAASGRTRPHSKGGVKNGDAAKAAESAAAADEEAAAARETAAILGLHRLPLRFAIHVAAPVDNFAARRVLPAVSGSAAVATPTSAALEDGNIKYRLGKAVAVARQYCLRFGNCDVIVDEAPLEDEWGGAAPPFNRRKATTPEPSAAASVPQAPPPPAQRAAGRAAARADAARHRIASRRAALDDLGAARVIPPVPTVDPTDQMDNDALNAPFEAATAPQSGRVPPADVIRIRSVARLLSQQLTRERYLVARAKRRAARVAAGEVGVNTANTGAASLYSWIVSLEAGALITNMTWALNEVLSDVETQWRVANAARVTSASGQRRRLPSLPSVVVSKPSGAGAILLRRDRSTLQFLQWWWATARGFVGCDKATTIDEALTECVLPNAEPLSPVPSKDARGIHQFAYNVDGAFALAFGVAPQPIATPAPLTESPAATEDNSPLLPRGGASRGSGGGAFAADMPILGKLAIVNPSMTGSDTEGLGVAPLSSSDGGTNAAFPRTPHWAARFPHPYCRSHSNLCADWFFRAYRAVAEDRNFLRRQINEADGDEDQGAETGAGLAPLIRTPKEKFGGDAAGEVASADDIEAAQAAAGRGSKKGAGAFDVSKQGGGVPLPPRKRATRPPTPSPPAVPTDQAWRAQPGRRLGPKTFGIVSVSIGADTSKGGGVQPASRMVHQSPYSSALKAAYCARPENDCDFILEDDAIRDPTRDGAWSKIPAIAKWLPHYEWIVWMDTDVLVMNFDHKLADILSKLHATQDTHFVVARDWNGLNSGVFFLRNTSWSADFLRRVWDRDNDPSCMQPRDWWEQRIIMCILDPRTSQATIQEDLKHTIETREIRLFNAYPAPISYGNAVAEYRTGDFIAHFPNCKAHPTCLSRFDALYGESVRANGLGADFRPLLQHAVRPLVA